VTRVLNEGVRNVRARYLAPLARFYACPPPVVDGLRLADFAVLTEDVDAMTAAMAAMPAGGG
jgi:hypothetical protein